MDSELNFLGTMRQDKFRHGRRGNAMNYMLVLVFYRYVYSSLHSYHDPRLKMGAKWPAFLGVNAWSDNIEGWILSRFALARCGRTSLGMEGGEML